LSQGIDLILMDLNLGDGIDGTEAAERILEDRDIPIVFVSSHTEPEIVEKTEKITSYGYVVKNSSITVLDASIKMAFKLFDAKKVAEKKERLIHEHEEKYRLLYEHAGVGIGYYSVDGIIQSYNQVAANHLGCVPEDLIGKSLYDLFPQADADLFLKRLKEALVSDHPVIYEGLVPFVSGKLYLLRTYTKIMDFEGNVLGVQVISQDITKIKQVEDELRLSKETAEMLLNIAAEIILSKDLDGNILLLNPAGHKLLGYESPELIGRNWFDLCLPAEEKEKVKRYFISLAKNNVDTIAMHENDIVIGSGEIRTIQWRNSMLKDRDGHPVGWFSSGEDVTERKKTEKALLESQERFRFALEGSELGEWDWDLKTGTLKRNERWAGMLGYTLTEINDNLQQGVDLQHPDDREAAWMAVKDHIEGKNGFYSIEYRMRTKSGSYKWIHDCGKIMERDEHGKPLRLCGTHADIDEQKKAADRIKALLAEKELILKEVHHRIKNNMNSIASLLSIQSDTVKEQSAALALLEAVNRIQSMSILYERLYKSDDYTHLSTKEYLSSLIHDVVDNFPNRDIVTVEYKLEDFSLDIKCLQPLSLIINELLTNIMKYAFNGRQNGLITVSVKKAEALVNVTIQDDGNGIPESIHFENSSGFGLMLVQALTRQLNGTVRIERDHGTRIVLEFKV